MKLSISLDDLCVGLPLGIKKFIEYSWQLGFYEKPDYYYLENLLKKCNEDSIPAIINDIESNSSCSIKFYPLSSKKKEGEFIHINDKEFVTVSCHTNYLVGEEDRNIIEKKYLQNRDSFRFNNILRTIGPFGLDENDLELFTALNNAINSYKTDQCYLVYRYVDNIYLEKVFNFIPLDIYYNLSMIKMQLGFIKIEKAFMSCYMTDTHVIEREVKLKVQIPKGINAFITRKTRIRNNFTL